MLGVGHPVVNVVAGHIRGRQKLRVIQSLVGRTARYGEYVRETLALRDSVGPSAIRFFEQDAIGALPIVAVRRVANLVEQVQVLDGGVIDAERRPDAGFSRAS